jgi:ferredoxin--NADP+ reductase
MTMSSDTAVEVQDRPDCHLETITEVEHYTDRLFRFRTTRPASLRFRSGEFVMIGLPGGERPVFRAYSIASPNWDDELEFFSIKVPGGPLTERLQKVGPGDKLYVKKKPTGTLVLDALVPGKRLWMLSTGTGVAPFASLLRDPETYEKFDEVILTQTCRTAAELRYAEGIVASLAEDPLGSEFAAGRVRLYTTVTREEHPRRMRITTAIETGKLFDDLGLAPFSPESDRVMICGSMEMIRDCRDLCARAGLVEGSNARPAQFVIERAFVG